MFNRPAVTYESAQTRKFQLGRTEVIRSASTESGVWARAMLDPTVTVRPITILSLSLSMFIYIFLSSPQDPVYLRSLFTRAAARHIQYANWAADGQGVDRHLFGLKRLLKDGESVPEIYSDPSFSKSNHWELSTSQLSSPYFDGWGYGEGESRSSQHFFFPH
jgi:carnitine O-acetyltransferase